MKYLSTFILLLFITSINYSQSFFGKKIKGNGNLITETRKTSDYDKITSAGSFNIVLIAGNEGNLTISADENLMPYILTEVNEGKLKVGFKKGYSYNTRNPINITVPFEDINSLTLSGSGNFTSEDPIKSDMLDVKISGSGNMDLTLDTKEMSSIISGSGDIKLNGNTNHFNCKTSGSGNVHAYNLMANDVTALISGSGNSDVNVSNHLDAKVSGSGNINYKGNPKTIDTKSSGSGNIRNR